MSKSIATSAPSMGSVMKNPNKTSQSPSAKSHPVKPSGKKGGGVKLASKGAKAGKKGSGYGKGR